MYNFGAIILAILIYICIQIFAASAGPCNALESERSASECNSDILTPE